MIVELKKRKRREERRKEVRLCGEISKINFGVNTRVLRDACAAVRLVYTHGAASPAQASACPAHTTTTTREEQGDVEGSGTCVEDP